MKKIYRYFFAAIAIASAASCAEQMEDNSALGTQNAPADFAQMTISASLGEVTKTTYDNQRVLWEGTESITVFSKGSEDTPTEFAMNWCSEDNTKASFTGLADLNAESYYAVYPHSATNACTAEGVLTVEIPAQQTAVAGGFASGANVSVAAFARDDESVIFNNVCSLLSFGFETDADAVLTKSVTVKVKKNATEYFGIAGNVSVNYNPEGALVVSEGTKDSIVLTAPTGGFAKGVTYYVLVAPVGQIAEMELTYTHTDGTTTCTRKNSNIIAALSRSTLVPLETIPVAYDNLPQEDFEVTIDFTGAWPLLPACKAIADQSTSSSNRDQYNLVYQNLELPMLLYKGNNGTGYVHETGKGLKYEGTTDKTQIGGALHLPAMPGRYVNKVVCQYTLPAGYPQISEMIRYYEGSVKLGFIASEAVTEDTKKEYAIEMPIVISDKTYGVRMSPDLRINPRYANFYYRKVIITYTKNKPE